MKSFLLILLGLALCSSGGGLLLGISEVDKWANAQIVNEPRQIHIITNSEAKKVMDYHGILSMKWSIIHHDFVFYREGILCRARAFEIIKEKR